MKVNKSETLRQSVLVSLLLGMVVGAWYFVFRPRDREDQDMRLQIAAKQMQLQKLNRATATIGNLKDEIANLEKAIDFFRSKLPNEKEIDKVLEEVWRLAEANNLTTKGIYTARRTAASPFVTDGSTQNEQPITMGFEGEFLGFYSFLLALEGQPRIMRVRSIGLECLEGKPGRIRAELEMSVFFEEPDSKKAPSWPKRT
jgi:Tfp pilus assembly protein PilO